MNENITTEALRILGFAALTLSVRILTWISMIGALVLFGFAVWKPDEARTIAASLFAVLVFIPALWNEKKERRPNLARVQTIHSQYVNGEQMEERI